jgi:hypothetical protein
METNELFEKKSKDAYLKLRTNNILFELYPHLSGIWSSDKIPWQDEYKKMVINSLKKK